jgi:hypothetical protein
VKPRIWPIILLVISSTLLFAQRKPILVFDGVNGYPSNEGSTYRIEIFISDQGYISEIRSFIGGSQIAEEETKVARKNNEIEGETLSRQSQTKFSLSIGEQEIKRHSIIVDRIKNTIFREYESLVKITPANGVAFDTGSRRYFLEDNEHFIIVDSKSEEVLYEFEKNQIKSDGWYKSEWKTAENKTYVHEFQTMERYAEWFDAGHGVFNGAEFKQPTLIANVINFCIMDAVYPNNTIFIPFIFGLKTGSY